MIVVDDNDLKMIEANDWVKRVENPKLYIEERGITNPFRKFDVYLESYIMRSLSPLATLKFEIQNAIRYKKKFKRMGIKSKVNKAKCKIEDIYPHTDTRDDLINLIGITNKDYRNKPSVTKLVNEIRDNSKDNCHVQLRIREIIEPRK